MRKFGKENNLLLMRKDSEASFIKIKLYKFFIEN